MSVASFSSRLLRLAAITFIVTGVAACRVSQPDFQGLVSTPLPTTEATLRQESERLGKLYDRHPGERQVSLRYAQVLRQLGNHSQAVAVLQQSILTNRGDPTVAAALGSALADAGEFKQATEVLANAHTPDRPNWRVMNVQGAVADQMGNHERAQELYLGALNIAPGEPAILSNLGLSYALSRRLGDAERVLTQAAQDPRADDRVRANLAMVQQLSRSQGSQPRQTNTWAQIKKAEQRKTKAISPDLAAAPTN